MAREIPYGSWPSPLTAADVSAASPRFEGARFVGDEIWWGESVPEEGGRTTVRRRRAGGNVENVLPAPWNARSRVHEYGGGSWTASDAGRIFFVEKSDQRIWAARPGETPVPLTGIEPGVRFGGLTMQEGVLVAVREQHESGRAPQRNVVSIATSGVPSVVAMTAGSDFVAQPALSPGGRHLAWVAWNHPDMPWDRSQLRVGRLEGRIVVEWATVTTGATSSLQPVWTAEDELLYLDDQTGRWNIWRLRLGAGAGTVTGTVIGTGRYALAPADADADTGGPLWVLGTRWYAALGDGRLVAVRTNGSDYVVV